MPKGNVSNDAKSSLFFFFMFNQNDSATRFRCPNTITGIKQPSKIVNFCTALAWLWFPADLTWIICTYAPLSNRAATVCNGKHAHTGISEWDDFIRSANILQQQQGGQVNFFNWMFNWQIGSFRIIRRIHNFCLNLENNLINIWYVLDCKIFQRTPSALFCHL